MNDKNDQRALLAVTLSLVVFTAWSFFFGPKPPEEPPVDPAAATAPAAGSTAAAPPEAPAASAVTEGPCTPAPVPLASTVAELSVDNCGRVVGGIRIVDKEAPIAVTPWWTWLWRTVTGATDGPWVPVGETTGPLQLLGEKGSFGAAGRGDLVPAGTWEVTQMNGGPLLRRMTADGLMITASVRPTADPDLFEITYRWEASRPLLGPLWVGIDDTLQDVAGAYDTHLRLSAVVDESLEALTHPSEITAPQTLEGPVGWLGISDRYFLAALIPDDPQWGQVTWAPTAEGRVGAFLVSTIPSLEPGNPIEARFKVYVGPKEAERLADVGHGLEEAAALGWFAFFGKIFLFLLHVLQKGLVNWGLSIAALTLLVRMALWPIMKTSFVNGKKMQLLAPKLKELQEKYGDDREGLGKATFALYAEEKVNPLSGCLPALIQIPIFLGLFNGLQSTPDLFHADFLYVRDLSMPDPYGLLPALMTVGMVVQQRMMPLTGMDPTQQQIMKLMPYMFAAFMFTMPAGLQVYYVVNTGLALYQQWYNTRSWDSQQKPASA